MANNFEDMFIHFDRIYNATDTQTDRQMSEDAIICTSAPETTSVPNYLTPR